MDDEELGRDHSRECHYRAGHQMMPPEMITIAPHRRDPVDRRILEDQQDVGRRSGTVRPAGSGHSHHVKNRISSTRMTTVLELASARESLRHARCSRGRQLHHGFLRGFAAASCPLAPALRASPRSGRRARALQAGRSTRRGTRRRAPPHGGDLADFELGADVDPLCRFIEEDTFGPGASHLATTTFCDCRRTVSPAGPRRPPS